MIWADRLNRLRVVPRLILVFFAGFTAWYVATVTGWYMALPSGERSMEASGLLAVTIPAVTGLFGAYCKHYTAWRPEKG